MGAPYPALAEVLFPLPDFFRDLVYDRVNYFASVVALRSVIGWCYLRLQSQHSYQSSGVRRLPIAGTTFLARPKFAS